MLNSEPTKAEAKITAMIVRMARGRWPTDKELAEAQTLIFNECLSAGVYPSPFFNGKP